MDENLVTIGIRGVAKQAKAASIMFIVLGALFIFLGLLIGIFAIANDSESVIATAIVQFGIVVPAGIAFIIIAIISLKYVENNDACYYQNKPVLVYNQEDDTFIGYDCRHNNKEMVFKNGDIVDIKGSAFWTGRELFVYYAINNKIKRVSLGFCRNIDNNALKRELNKYSKIKL